MTFRQQLALTAKLSLPAMLAQVSSILMQYIDASMVGHLGADASASIGLMSSSMWLYGGVCSALTLGFAVQVAHRVGATDYAGARNILRQSLTTMLVASLLISLSGIAIAWKLPGWLGGTEAINGQASAYFLVFAAALPMLTMNYLAGGMLRCAGNMKIPSLLNVLMCVLDIPLNFFLIFPGHVIDIAGYTVTLPGAGLGVLGAALGTASAEVIVACLMLYFLCFRERGLRIVGERGSFRPVREILVKAVRISAPMTVEHAIFAGAQIMITVIVAPLGVVAIAANAFAVTAESLCYMPGFGIGDAATTLVGQSHGAGRPELVRRFGYITVGFGVAVMTVMGAVMYVCAPLMMEVMTPVAAIRDLGAEVLRIEAWAEPMYAAAIVSYGVFVGMGDTIVPACMNFGSIWLVRIPIAAFLAPRVGLVGVWIAMCVELCFRGVIFLIRLFRGRWANVSRR